MQLCDALALSEDTVARRRRQEGQQGQRRAAEGSQCACTVGPGRLTAPGGGHRGGPPPPTPPRAYADD